MIWKLKYTSGTFWDQESVIRQVMGPRGKPNTITLLRGCIELTSNAFSSYVQIITPFSPHQRSFFWQMMAINRKKTQVFRVQKIRDYRMFHPNWDIFIATPSPSKKGSLKKSKGQQKCVRAGCSGRLHGNLFCGHSRTVCTYELTTIDTS